MTDKDNKRIITKDEIRKEIRSENNTQYDEYGLNPTFKQKIFQILPTEDECKNLSKPVYLLDNATTKYFGHGSKSFRC